VFVKGKILPLLLGVAMTIIILGAFLYAEPEATLGEAGRVIFFHIPAAWVAVLAFFLSMVSSIQYLRLHRMDDDHGAVAAAELGLIFTVIATITGSIFANLAWGSPWNWDPRETTIFILLLIYLAYFALRAAIEEDERRARLSAVYAIVAFITVPFLVFIIPRVYWSLHPDPLISQSGQAGMDMTPRMLRVFLSALVAFTGLFFWMYRLQVRIARLHDRLQTRP
jgi:heme exporter protein C